MTTNPGWLPDGRTITTVRAGVDWDAVRIRTPLAEAVLALLGNHTGAVIEDTWGRTMYWLVPVGTAASWTAPFTTALGPACWLTVPGPRSDHGIYWRVPLTTPRGSLTCPLHLAEALTTARTREPAS